jgi:hypothetical protein
MRSAQPLPEIGTRNLHKGKGRPAREADSLTAICESEELSSGMLRRVAFVRTDVSEEPSASFIRVTIGELGTTLAATSNRRTLRRTPKHRFLQEPHGVTSQKTALFMNKNYILEDANKNG